MVSVQLKVSIPLNANGPVGLGGAEHLRFTGDNWLPEQLAFEANQSLIIACQLLRDSPPPPIGYLH